MLGFEVRPGMSSIEAARLVFAVLSDTPEKAGDVIDEIAELEHVGALVRFRDDDWCTVGPEFLDADFRHWLGRDLLSALSSLIEQLHLRHDAFVGIRLRRVAMARMADNEPVVWIAVRVERGLPP